MYLYTLFLAFRFFSLAGYPFEASKLVGLVTQNESGMIKKFGYMHIVMVSGCWDDEDDVR